MSYVITGPKLMSAAAADLSTIGSDLDAAHTAAATHTTGLAPAAADEVSAGVARLFSQYADDFHALAGKAAAFGEQFVGNLHAGAASYTGAEAANTAALSIPSSISQLLENLPTIPNLVLTLENLPVVGVLAQAVFATLGISLFLLILVTLWIAQMVETFLAQFGL